MEAERLVSWCSHNNLVLNTQKTAEVVVDFRKHTHPIPPLNLSGTPITMVDSCCFLGTTINQDLKWEPTITQDLKWEPTITQDLKWEPTIRKKAQQRMYVLKFGLAPHIIKELISAANNAGPFVLMFDESFNQSTKNKQLDVRIRFWDAGAVQSRYLGSQFVGHSKAKDLLHHFKDCVRLLDTKNLLSISMDGPNVNLKFLNDFQQEHAELHGGRQLIHVGSCGLHTPHNSFKTGFSTWNIEKLLRAMHFLFHNVPARREDFTKLTGSSLFPLPFCGHRWVENLPVAERAIEVWPKLKEYVKAVHRKELPNPGTSSFDTIQAANEDPDFSQTSVFHGDLQNL
ncbi:uncharacterized protein [Nothobranchius furzeri]|uniref:uncharacterized protein n=1 Tax=Nothobranchius furzeri TaxID=105023 RepID=UPI003904CFBE